MHSQNMAEDIFFPKMKMYDQFHLFARNIIDRFLQQLPEITLLT